VSSSSSSLGLSSSSSDSTEQACNNTKLLLHMDGTDGSTDFKDDSDSQHAVTANGDAQVDTAQSKFGGASGLFDGTGDYLSLADSADWSFGSGDFTIEAWVKANAGGTQLMVMSSGLNGGLFGWSIQLGGTGDKFFRCDTDGGVFDALIGTTDIVTDGAWHHLACTRSGNTKRLFTDGVLEATSTISGVVNDVAGPLGIGAINVNGSWTQTWNGWIDEVRIVKGVAVWTSNFTPPTAPYDCPNESSSSSSSFGYSSSSSSSLGYSSSSSSSFGYSSSSSDSTEQVCLNTKLLLHMDGEDGSTIFKDESDSQHAITANGSAQVDTAQSKFGGASGLFGGSGDYLSVPHSTDFDFGTGDFTIECWVRYTSRPGSTIVMGYNDGSSFTYWLSRSEITDRWGFEVHNGVSHRAEYTMDDGVVINNDQWYHIAWVRKGNDMLGFVDGVSKTINIITAFNGNINLYPSEQRFGNIDGHIDEIRVVKGLAVYTSNFTPPTAPYDCPNESSSSSFDSSSSSSSSLGYSSSSSSSFGYSSSSSDSTEQVCLNTKLLLHMDGTDGSTKFQDESNSQHTVTAEDNAQIDTSEKKFGTGSGLFDGSGDYLSVASSTDFDISSGDFTLELWFRANSLHDADLISIGTSNYNAVAIGNRAAGLFVFTGSTNGSAWNAQIVSSSSLYVTNTWYHLAAVRSGNRITMFLDGSDIGSVVVSGSLQIDVNSLRIAEHFSSAFGPFDGRLDEVRIVKGVAAWTSDFTPPTSPYDCPNESSSSSGGFSSSSSSEQYSSSSSSSSGGFSSSSSSEQYSSSSSSSSLGFSSSSSESTEQACLNTKLLLHMDGEDGSTNFKDESDSQHDGRRRWVN
jgi:hypothetical protein